MNNNLIPLIKCWNFPDGNYGEKRDFWLNTDIEIKHIEACKVNKNGTAIECTKIYYPGSIITVQGTPQQFFEACRQSNIAVCLLNDLYKEGITIKQFIQQTERLNGITL